MTPQEEQYLKARLTLVAYEFGDACVAKAIRKLKEDPERSAYPYRDIDPAFLQSRLREEVEEVPLAPTEAEKVDQLTDVGNFSAWRWKWGMELLKREAQTK